MARLTALKSALRGLPSTIAFMPKDEIERDRFRDKQHWRAWYKSARWRALRKHVLMRDGYRCRMCGRIEGNTTMLVADHIERHGGDEVRFFDAAGLQTLCAPCHNSAKQSQERRA